MKLIESPISILFFLLEIFAFSRYSNSPTKFVDPIYMEAWTGIPLVFMSFILIRISWPDKLILYLRKEMERKGSIVTLRLFVFIGGSVYVLHHIVSFFK